MVNVLVNKSDDDETNDVPASLTHVNDDRLLLFYLQEVSKVNGIHYDETCEVREVRETCGNGHARLSLYACARALARTHA